jgi:AcrR family transcriptional regulator
MEGRRRNYDASRRREAAEETRRTILTAARRLFAERGYVATTMPAIASAAGVALDTVYASVGKKPALFRLLVELAISGQDHPVPALERSYVKDIRAEPDAARKLGIYAAAVCSIQPRLAPLARVLAEAAGQDPSLAAIWRDISDRRAENMRLFARDLQGTGALRPELSVDVVADVIWSMNGPEYYHLLVERRGWTLDQYERWLVTAWIRLLLREPATA